MKTVFVVLVITGSLVLCAMAQSTTEISADDLIYLKAGRFRPEQLETGMHVFSNAADDTARTYLVQFSAGVDDDGRRAVETRHAIKLGSYVPSRSYVVFMTPSKADAVRTSELVRAVVYYAPSAKRLGIETLPPLSQVEVNQMRAQGDDAVSGLEEPTQDVYANLVYGDDPSSQRTHAETLATSWLSDITSAMSSAGMEGGVASHAPSNRRVIVTAKKSHVDFVMNILAGKAEVEFVDVPAPVALKNENAAWITQSGGDVSGYTPLWNNGITGAGLVAGVGDTGLDYDHCMFWDSTRTTTFSSANRKVVGIAFRSSSTTTASEVMDDHGHGTHVAGTIAGKCESCATTSSSWKEKGMAYDAKLFIQDLYKSGGFSVPGDLVNNFFNYAYAKSATVHNNSWGPVCTGSTLSCTQYGSRDQDIDQFSYSNKDFLILFAAGNDGSCGDRSCGNNAKNALIVGATGATQSIRETLASFSSQGPSGDDRIKPDLVAPGWSITSASTNGVVGESCGFTGMSGTSMATPVAAGTALLVQQYFKDGWYPTARKTSADGFTPSSALVKAMLLHSTKRLTTITSNSGKPFSYEQGYGRMELDRVIPLASSSPFALEILSLTDSKTEKTIAQGQTETFTIRPSSVGLLEVTLVWNDPAASVSSSKALDGTTVRGNHLTAADQLNNNEQVLIENASIQTYTVQVTATTINSGSNQDYALVATYKTNNNEPPSLELKLTSSSAVFTWGVSTTTATTFTLTQADDRALSTNSIALVTDVSTLTLTRDITNYTPGKTYYFQIKSTSTDGAIGYTTLEYTFPSQKSDCSGTTPKRCEDGSCVDASANCPTASACTGTRCDDGTCVGANDSCPTFDGCPVNKIQCESGRCVDNQNSCNGDCESGETLCWDGTCATEGSCTDPPSKKKPVRKSVGIKEYTATTITVEDSNGGTLGSVIVGTTSVPAQSNVAVDAVQDSVISSTSAKSYYGVSEDSPKVLSPVMEVTIENSNGGKQTLSGPVQLSFDGSSIPESLKSNMCMAYIDDTGAWKCEDKAMTVSGSNYVGSTSHFTTYAVVNRQGLLNDSDDDNTSSNLSGFEIALIAIGSVAAVAVAIVCCSVCAVLICGVSGPVAIRQLLRRNDNDFTQASAQRQQRFSMTFGNRQPNVGRSRLIDEDTAPAIPSALRSSYMARPAGNPVLNSMATRGPTISQYSQPPPPANAGAGYNPAPQYSQPPPPPPRNAVGYAAPPNYGLSGPSAPPLPSQVPPPLPQQYGQPPPPPQHSAPPVPAKPTAFNTAAAPPPVPSKPANFVSAAYPNQPPPPPVSARPPGFDSGAGVANLASRFQQR